MVADQQLFTDMLSGDDMGLISRNACNCIVARETPTDRVHMT